MRDFQEIFNAEDAEGNEEDAEDVGNDQALSRCSSDVPLRSFSATSAFKGMSWTSTSLWVARSG